MPVERPDHTLQILREIHDGRAVSQRTLAETLGIALGLTNSLLKRLVQQGYVRITGVPPVRMRYFLTRRGFAELTRRAADSMENTVRLYTSTRDRIREQLTALEARSPDGSQTRIVFYGAGNVAELAYITLHGSRLRLVGVVDDRKAGGRFFDHPVRSPEMLSDGTAPDHDVIVVTTFKRADDIRARLAQLDVPDSRVFYLAQSVIQCLPDFQPDQT